MTTERQKSFLVALLAGYKLFINLLNNIKVLLSLRVMRLMFMSDFNQFSFSRQFFLITNIKFDENPSCGSRADTRGQTGRRT